MTTHNKHSENRTPLQVLMHWTFLIFPQHNQINKFSNPVSHEALAHKKLIAVSPFGTYAFQQRRTTVFFNNLNYGRLVFSHVITWAS